LGALSLIVLYFVWPRDVTKTPEPRDAARDALTKTAPTVSEDPWKGLPPVPKYKIYRQSSTEPTTVVVAENSTDEQLHSLLWFFRRNIRSHDFKAIGLTIPTSTKYGAKTYGSGMLIIFKGSRCANENYGDGIGPCGRGDHSAATYEWGISEPDEDSGSLTSEGNVYFNFHDGWKPAAGS
jgi:hypothetical protein